MLTISLFALNLLALMLLPACGTEISARQASVEPAIDGTITLPANLTWEEVNLSTSGQGVNAVKVACSAQYGTGLEARSCFDALSFVPRGNQMEAWVPWPAAGVPPSPVRGVVQLPILIVSNDTSCLIHPDLGRPAILGHASALNVSEAARAIIKTCVIPRRIGGLAADIGGDNKILVDVKHNRNRRAQCTSPVRATPKSCGYILDEMNKSVQREFFADGVAHYLETTVALPLTLRSPDGLCQIVVDTPATPGTQFKLVISSFQQVWVAAELVVAGCIRAGKGGRISVIGKQRSGMPTDDLIVTIMDEPAHIVLPGDNDGAVQNSSSEATA